MHLSNFNASVYGWAHVLSDTLDIRNECMTKVGTGRRLSPNDDGIREIHRDDGYVGPADCGTPAEITIQSEYANANFACCTKLDGTLFFGVGNAETIMKFEPNSYFFIGING